MLYPTELQGLISVSLRAVGSCCRGVHGAMGMPGYRSEGGELVS